MADQSSTPLGLPPTVWIVVALGVAGMFAVHQHPFRDTRPPDATPMAYRHSPSENQDVEARQWEDPLTAVAIATESATSPHDLETLAHEVIVEEAGRKPAQAAQILLLGAMVPGAPYADDIETRRRIRYALLAGLYGRGYVPESSEHIGYVSLAGIYPVRRPRDFAAYEWFAKENPVSSERPSHVLVMWLDQDGFRESPLARFSTVIDCLVPPEDGSTDKAINAATNAACPPTAGTPPPAGTPPTAGTPPAAAPTAAAGAAHKVEVALLGPADSDGLRAMRDELRRGTDKDAGSPLHSMSVYSDRATASDGWVLGDNETGDAKLSRYGSLAEYFEIKSSGKVHLLRSIGTDADVVKQLYQELKYRGVSAFSDIALVFERDTLYARAMAHYFHGCQGTPPIPDRSDTIDGDRSQPWCFTYLRGLDGFAPPSPTSKGTGGKSGGAGEAAGKHSADPPPDAAESAFGQSQLDYLRRLAADLSSKHRIKAIGVVGSDIYDKVLILQALRSVLPRVTFFTTDLDARFIDPQNLPATRQLIVGSSLGLSLRPELQRTVPPFRDGYQAAAYYSTMLAIDCFEHSRAPACAHRQDDTGNDTPAPPPTGLEWTAKPRVFEIGRSQIFDLTGVPSPYLGCEVGNTCPSVAAPRIAPAWSRMSAATSAVGVLGFAVLTGLFFWVAQGTTWTLSLFSRGAAAAAKPQSPGKLIGMVLILVFIALAALLVWWGLTSLVTHGGTRIPPPIIGGSFQLTATLVELLSVAIVATLVVRGHRKLHDNAAQMLTEFGFERNPESLIDWRATQLKGASAGDRRRERFWFPTGRLSLRTAYRGTDASMSKLEALIAQYLHRGTTRARLMRVTIITAGATVLLLLLELVLVILEFNLGTSFASGVAVLDSTPAMRQITNGMALLNLFAVQFLIFWVTDAMLLTRSFTLALTHDRPEWPEALLSRKCVQLGLPTEWTATWMNLQLVAKRTTRVSSLVWYPALVIAATAIAAMSVDFGEFGFASNPIALLIGAVVLIAAGILLRRAAEWARSVALVRLKDARLRESGPGAGPTDAAAGAAGAAATPATPLPPPPTEATEDPPGAAPGATEPAQPAPKAGSGNRVAQLDQLIERVTEVNEGAFAPYSQQPLVRAVLVPALTYGATAMLQYLHLPD